MKENGKRKRSSTFFSKNFAPVKGAATLKSFPGSQVPVACEADFHRQGNQTIVV